MKLLDFTAMSVSVNAHEPGPELQLGSEFKSRNVDVCGKFVFGIY